MREGCGSTGGGGVREGCGSTGGGGVREGCGSTGGGGVREGCGRTGGGGEVRRKEEERSERVRVRGSEKEGGRQEG